MVPSVITKKAWAKGIVSIQLASVLALACACGSRSAISVNQLGYLPLHPKLAVLESGSTQPKAVELIDSTGAVRFRGVTTVYGFDAESGDNLHHIRFDAFREVGHGYRLRIGDEVSASFEIAPDLYRRLKLDALAYFYHNRSGMPVAMPWAKDFKWTRPSGHLSDREVECIGGSCSYTLDVHGGWYDAGDHGKYVVNGGIALYTLLSLQERSVRAGRPLCPDPDRCLSIPEQQNGRDDLLDEAAYEMAFLMRMQVPPGQPKAGMVHHKIHDSSWTPLGRSPEEHARQRYLHPPSTAATLNLAATAAVCARVFQQVTPRLARLCHEKAVSAWDAALRHPAVFASPMSRDGGGPYDDRDVKDEFYWAAAELYLYLGEPRLLAYLKQSPHYLVLSESTEHERVRHFSPMTWQSTAALGTLSLALVRSELPESERARAREAILEVGDRLLELTHRRGYRVPMQVGSDGKYPWGSNSFVLNNAWVLAVCHELSREPRYLEGVISAMNYLLGTNPLGFSYISGYGEASLENPHHRFWAHKKGRCPRPPPGAIAGGPNSTLPDPVSKRLMGCAPQRCYLDHVDAWGVNEVAINWNAPLAWVAAYLDQPGGAT